jgi:hypothetical protein
LELVQVPPGIVEIKLVEKPIHIACVPLRVPALGIAETVTERELVALGQPPVPATV